jgi:hypothetical protein
MPNKTWFAFLAFLTVVTVSTAQAGPCDAFFDGRGSIPGINAGTTLAALGRSALDRNATGREIARDALIGTGIGELVKLGTRKANQNKCEEALEDLCLNGEDAACSQLRMLDRNRYHRVMDERGESGNRRPSYRQDSRNDDRDSDRRRSNSRQDDRYEPRRSQQSSGDDYLINNGNCSLIVDGIVVEKGKGTRFTFRQSSVRAEGSKEELDLIYSKTENAFMPLPPRS